MVSGIDERPQEPHLCGLWSAAWSTKGSAQAPMPVASLPTPNIVEGVPAALLTHCETKQIRCLVALALQDGAQHGEGTFRAFDRLEQTFQDLGLLGRGSWPPDWKAMIG